MRKNQITTTNELKNAVTQSKVIIVTANIKADYKSVDYAETIKYCKQIGASLQKGSLVVYGEIAGFSFIENLFKETLEDTSGLKAGRDFGLAYSPLRNMKLIGIQEGIVAAADRSSLTTAASVIGTLTKKGIKAVSDIKTAELSILFQCVKHDVNVALANELAIFCENAGVDYAETVKIAESDNLEKNIVSPTITRDHQKEAYLLKESAENLNIKLRLPALAMQISEDIIKHSVNLIQQTLKDNNKTFRRAKIAIISSVNIEAATIKLVQLLEAKGVKIRLYQPQKPENILTGIDSILKKTIKEAVEDTDCIVILSEPKQMRLSLKKLKTIMRKPAAIVDLTGTIEPNVIQEEGFTYRGMGRGSWRK